MKESANRFAKLFEGLHRAHGQYDINRDLSSRKAKVLGAAVTRENPVTEELWLKHVTGQQGLGIIPIRDDQCVVFAALDIDDYKLDIKALNAEIQKLQLPFVATRTKSGGCHLYVFFKDPVKAELVFLRLKEIAAAIGYPKVEIFPKQRELGPTDLGNWINMPYFACKDESGKDLPHERFGLDDKGSALTTLEQYLAHCEQKKVSGEAFMALELPKVEKPFMDGPPCLQRLAVSGFTEGIRNDSFYQIGVYLRVKYPRNWREKMEEYNHQLMDPPLKMDEVKATIKSISNERNFYVCTRPPFDAVCSRETCLGRRYGIGLGANEGNGELELILGSFKKTETRIDDQVIDDTVNWYVTVDGIEMRFTTSELFSQDRMRMRIAERLKKVPLPVRPQRYQALIKEKIESASTILKSLEQSHYADLWAALLSYLEMYGGADTRAEVDTGKVWEQEGFLWFKRERFNIYLKKQDIIKTNQDRTDVYDTMENHFGAERKQLMVDSGANKNVECWKLPKPKEDSEEVLPEPKSAPREF